MSYQHRPPENDVVMRLVVTRRVTGPVPALRKHKILQKLKRLIALVGAHSTYHIDVAEVADVRKVQ